MIYINNCFMIVLVVVAVLTYIPHTVIKVCSCDKHIDCSQYSSLKK